MEHQNISNRARSDETSKHRLDAYKYFTKRNINPKVYLEAYKSNITLYSKVILWIPLPLAFDDDCRYTTVETVFYATQFSFIKYCLQNKSTKFNAMSKS